MIEIIPQMIAENHERDFIFNQARQTANKLGKSLLNAGCGWRYKLAIEESDVNLDMVPRDVP